VQFHPEFDADTMRGYIDMLADGLRTEGTDPAALRERVAATDAAAALLGRFARIVEASTRASEPERAERAEGAEGAEGRGARASLFRRIGDYKKPPALRLRCDPPAAPGTFRHTSMTTPSPTPRSASISR
jgi:hypothetical protein